MATVLITGGTGLVGKALGQALLQKGYSVIILSRNPGQAPGGALKYAGWNVEEQTIDKTAIAEADYIIHLAGAGVAEKRWTAKRKKEIIESRVNSSRLITEKLQRIPNKIKAVISASAIGWYGADPVIPNPAPFTEEAPASNDFLGATCAAWEKSTEPVKAAGIRLVKLRIGIVLSKQGGAVKEIMKPMRFGIAGILGNGKQVMSWIHIDDLVQLFITALENEQLKGVYNAVAPQPVSNKALTLALAKSRKKFYIPVKVPSFVLKAMLGEMSTEVLKSATVSCGKALEAGFVFRYNDIQEAMAHLC